MKNSIYTLIILFTILFVGSEVQAKSIFSGFVVTNNNDTLQGQVYVVSPTVNELKVKFIDANNKKLTFKANDLQSYSFEVPKFDKASQSHGTETITYIRKVVEDAPVRMGSTDIMIERQVNGSIQVYNQYIEMDEKIGGALNHFFYVEKTGAVNFSKVSRDNFKEIMQKATVDYPELSNKIGTSGFGYKSVVKIAELYNLRDAQRAMAN